MTWGFHRQGLLKFFENANYCYTYHIFKLCCAVLLHLILNLDILHSFGQAVWSSIQRQVPRTKFCLCVGFISPNQNAPKICTPLKRYWSPVMLTCASSGGKNKISVSGYVGNLGPPKECGRATGGENIDLGPREKNVQLLLCTLSTQSLLTTGWSKIKNIQQQTE